MTVYAYFDSDPLPMTAATAAATAAQNNQQLQSVQGQQGDNNHPRRKSSLSNWTGNGAGKVVVVASDTLRQTMMRAMSKRSVNTPVPPNLERTTLNGKTPSDPPAPATTTTFGKLVVVVTDNGPGISPENQKRLFKEVISCFPRR